MSRRIGDFIYRVVMMIRGPGGCWFGLADPEIVGRRSVATRPNRGSWFPSRRDNSQGSDPTRQV